MSQRQHYVPQIYLKQFTLDLNGFFFRAKPKPYSAGGISKRHINNVCYLEDFYVFQNTDVLEKLPGQDANFIETNAFAYENRLDEIFSIFKSRSDTIERSVLHEFISIILSIKHRNPFYKKEFVKLYADKENLERVLSREALALKRQLGVTEDNPVIDSIIEGIKVSISNDQGLPDESYKRTIVENALTTDTPIEEVKLILAEMDLIVMEPVSETCYFITSDNPGFTLVGDKVYNTQFGEFNAVGFPINSRQAVLFVNRRKENGVQPVRNIEYRKLDRTQVELYNYCTIFNSQESIFCENKEYLSSVISSFNAR